MSTTLYWIMTYIYIYTGVKESVNTDRKLMSHHISCTYCILFRRLYLRRWFGHHYSGSDISGYSSTSDYSADCHCNSTDTVLLWLQTYQETVRRHYYCYKTDQWAWNYWHWYQTLTIEPLFLCSPFVFCPCWFCRQFPLCWNHSFLWAWLNLEYKLCSH